MKKLISCLLVSILLFGMTTPLVFASSNNFKTNDYTQEPSGLIEKEYKEDGILKKSSQFNYQGEKIKIIQYQLNNSQRKYIFQEGDQISEVIHDEANNKFLVDGKSLEVKVSIKNIKEQDPLKGKIIEKTNNNLISPLGYYPNPPYGNSSDYYYVDTSYIDIRLSKTLGTIGVSVLSTIIAAFCPVSIGISYSIAQGVLATVGIWTSNNYLKCVQANYKHKLPFYKKYYARYYYDKYYGALGARKTWYYSGLDSL